MTRDGLTRAVTTNQKTPGLGPRVFWFGGEGGIDDFGLVGRNHPFGAASLRSLSKTLTRFVEPEGSHPRRDHKPKTPGLGPGVFGLAVREGFEPSIGINLYTLSRRAPSTARTPHQILFSSRFLTVGIDDNGLGPLSPLRGSVAALLVQIAGRNLSNPR